MKQKIKTGILMTALAVGSLHIVNRCAQAFATVKNLLDKHKGAFYDWRFGQIYYTKTGSDSPLLLVHDLAPAASSYEWDLLLKNLSADHTVYCLDLLGCGRSDKPNLTYTNYFYVQLINDFIEHVIHEKTDIIATGLSSSFVLMACSTNPDAYNKIMMINPESISNLKCTPSKRSRIIKFIMDLPIVGTAVYNMQMRRENIEYLFTEKYFYNPFSVSKKMLDIYHEAAHLDECGGKYLLSSLDGFYLNADISRALNSINNSLFILEGRKTEERERTVEGYVRLNSAVEYDFIENTEKYPQMENPQAVLEYVDMFF